MHALSPNGSGVQKHISILANLSLNFPNLRREGFGGSEQRAPRTYSSSVTREVLKFRGHDRVCRKWEAPLSGERSIWTDSQESPAWMISRAKAGEQRKLIRRWAGTSALLERRLTPLRGALCGRVLLPAREKFRRSSGCMRIGRCCASMSYVENIYLFSSKLP